MLTFGLVKLATLNYRIEFMLVIAGKMSEIKVSRIKTSSLKGLDLKFLEKINKIYKMAITSLIFSKFTWVFPQTDQRFTIFISPPLHSSVDLPLMQRRFESIRTLSLAPPIIYLARWARGDYAGPRGLTRKRKKRKKQQKKIQSLTLTVNIGSQVNTSGSYKTTISTWGRRRWRIEGGRLLHTFLSSLVPTECPNVVNIWWSVISQKISSVNLHLI